MGWTTLRVKAARIRREKLLPGLGWVLVSKGRWRSPRSQIVMDYEVAIAAEQLRGGIRENGKNWKI